MFRVGAGALDPQGPTVPLGPIITCIINDVGIPNMHVMKVERVVLSFHFRLTEDRFSKSKEDLNPDKK